MNRVLIITKTRDLAVPLAKALEECFAVQYSSDDVSEVLPIMEIVKPNIIIAQINKDSLVESSLFSTLSLKYSHIPIFTIASEEHKKRYLRYYNLDQFENYPDTTDEITITEDLKKRFKITSVPTDIGDEKMLTSGSRRKILICDDNAATLRSIKSMLDEYYNCTIVTSAAKMMVAIEKNMPDLILLDYEMPVVDGRQALEMIRSDEDYKDIPVIFLTGVNDREAIASVAVLNPNGYILKPPARDKLHQAIEKVIWQQ